MGNSRSSSTSDKKSSVIDGIALGLSFLLISGFLYINPSFLHYELISYIFGTLLGVFGLFGVLVEIGKIDENYNEATNNIGAALLAGLVAYGLYSLFSNVFVNILVLLLSLVILYGFLKGIIKIIEIILDQQTIKDTMAKLSVFILNLFVFILTVLQLLQISKIIK